MSGRHVVVVGGGLAGIRAALSCADAGARVTLLEARPRLGGATFSTRFGGLDVDNGQHVFLRCCAAYRELLERLEVSDRVFLQPRLDVPVLAPGGRVHHLRRAPLPAPAHLLPSVLGFGHLSLGARLRAGWTAARLKALDRHDPRADATSFHAWLLEQGESPRSIARFWDLLVVATLNVPCERASLAQAAMVYQTGLLEDAPAADIGWSRVPLSQLHGEPAAVALEKAGVRTCLRARVRSIETHGGLALQLEGERLAADGVVLAVPHEAAAALLPDAAKVDRAGLRALGRSPIVNLHVVFDRPVLTMPLAAGIETPLQWLFDRSEAAGLEPGRYVVVSLSAADRWVGASRQALRRVFLPAFADLLSPARGAVVEAFHVTCERAATFVPAPGSGSLRPGPVTAQPGLFLAGAWTDSGWPATMEGAVLSGKAAARATLAHLGLHALAEAA
ncbi:MAG: hydroxysqualene dehydroxylase HpnE [Myxococcota bacterium]|nr:hydroxysqualene dehydroxylase HpnE [Myxococcota bacterium]